MKRIEICGCIASGKTTLAKCISKKGFYLCCETFDKNPFLEDFYINNEFFSFETEITFLLQHYHAIKKNRSSNLSVYDFSLIQDLAYADGNLSGKRHEIFINLSNELLSEVMFPSLIIHIRCTTECSLYRINKRKRSMEQGITTAYLEKLTSSLDKRIKNLPSKVKVFTIDSEFTDFRQKIPKDLEQYIESSL